MLSMCSPNINQPCLVWNVYKSYNSNRPTCVQVRWSNPTHAHVHWLNMYSHASLHTTSTLDLQNQHILRTYACILYNMILLHVRTYTIWTVLSGWVSPTWLRFVHTNQRFTICRRFGSLWLPCSTSATFIIMLHGRQRCCRNVCKLWIFWLVWRNLNHNE